MGRKVITYVIITVVALGAIMLLQYNKPKKLNWYESYVATHKIPYGTFVFNEIMPKLFPEKVKEVHVAPFEFLRDSKNIEGSYFFVNNKVAFEEAELESLLEWTSEGNILFIASKSFEAKLLDTLHLDIGTIYGGFEVSQKQQHALVNPVLRSKDSIRFEKGTYASYFKEIDTLNTIVLGTVNFSQTEIDTKNTEKINGVQQSFGKGKIILSTFPEAFTNYFLLNKNNKEYTAGILSYLNDSKNVYLDNHHKSGKAFYTSPMYIFLNTKELKWAYYTALIGVLIYVVFEGKRKQRAVPVVKPLQNQTLAFTRTIADMYYEKRDQKKITEHRINYFLDHVRSKYYLGNILSEDDFYTNLSGRSGHSYDTVKTIFTFMETLRGKAKVTDNELIKLNKLIQKFKSKPDGK